MTTFLSRFLSRLLSVVVRINALLEPSWLTLGRGIAISLGANLLNAVVAIGIRTADYPGFLALVAVSAGWTAMATAIGFLVSMVAATGAERRERFVASGLFLIALIDICILLSKLPGLLG